MIKTQYNIVVRAIRSDNGGEYISDAFCSQLNQKGILHQLTCRHRRKIQPLNREVCLGSFLFIFLDTDPHLASVVCVPLSLFRFEI
jgi:hypothetical protein